MENYKRSKTALSNESTVTTTDSFNQFFANITQEIIMSLPPGTYHSAEFAKSIRINHTSHSRDTTRVILRTPGLSNLRE